MELKINTGASNNAVTNYIKWGVVGGAAGYLAGALIRRGGVLWYALGGFLIVGYIGQTFSSSKKEVKKSNFINYSIKK